tara:strand:+ start:316 stop:771 length:456 start_codon:yes stop_codon:yes gene_type:complete
MHIAINNSRIDISSPESTKKLAENFTKYLDKGSIVFFYGEIGVGKTTFIKYFINAYQKNYKLQTTEVTSPTFNLLNEYEVGDLIIKHYDLYRLKKKSEINNLDLFEDTKNTISLIEWPELVDKNKSFKIINLIFSYENDFNNRYVKISGLT